MMENGGSFWGNSFRACVVRETSAVFFSVARNGGGIWLAQTAADVGMTCVGSFSPTKGGCCPPRDEGDICVCLCRSSSPTDRSTGCGVIMCVWCVIWGNTTTLSRSFLGLFVRSVIGAGLDLVFFIYCLSAFSPQHWYRRLSKAVGLTRDDTPFSQIQLIRFPIDLLA